VARGGRDLTARPVHLVSRRRRGGQPTHQSGKLAAVIDFGTCGVGDPACDLVITWTLFRDVSRTTFKSAVAQDSATWTRARGWALWKALIGLARDIDVDEPAAMITRGVIDAVLTDHQQAG